MKSIQTIAAGGTSAIGGVVGGVGGAVAGSQAGDDEHKFRNALAGGVLGAAGGTYAKGMGNVLKDNWKSLETFNKTVGGKTYQFQRSGLGKVVNPLLGSGAGFGAMEAMTSKNEDGSKRSIGNRLARGAGTAVSWSAAPKLMTGKLLGYDIPKIFTGMKRPKQQNENGLLP
jgi:ABC-type phosphate transport system substrate-binding protein